MRVRLKIGPVEIEMENDEGVSREDVLALAEDAAALYQRQQLGGPVGAEIGAAAPGSLRIQGSTASIASRLNCISAPELIVAAAARMTFVDGREWFEAADLLEEMRTAAAHYEGGYEATLDDDIEGLVESGKLVLVSDRLYALSATMRRELQQALAE